MGRSSLRGLRALIGVFACTMGVTACTGTAPSASASSTTTPRQSLEPSAVSTLDPALAQLDVLRAQFGDVVPPLYGGCANVVSRVGQPLSVSYPADQGGYDAAVDAVRQAAQSILDFLARNPLPVTSTTLHDDRISACGDVLTHLDPFGLAAKAHNNVTVAQVEYGMDNAIGDCR